MKILGNMDKRSRFAVCATLLLLSLLLIGAGRITGELQDQNANKEMEKERCIQLVMGMASEIPAENRAEWIRAAKENPQALLKLSTIEFKTVSSSGI